MKRLMKLTQDLRSDLPGGEQGKLHGADMYIILDAGKTGLKRQILNSGFEQPINSRFIQVYFDLASLAANTLCAHGTINQLVGCHLVTSSDSPPKRVKKQREIYGGGSNGNVIGPVVAPNWTASTTWVLPPNLKQSVYGPDNRIPVGGKFLTDCTDDMDDGEIIMKGRHCRKGDDEVEVVFFLQDIPT